MNSSYQPNKRAKQLGRLHPYWGAPNSQDDISENQDSSLQILSRTDDDENSVTTSTQGKRSLLESSQSISNSRNEKILPDQMQINSVEIQHLIERYSALLSDSVRIARTACSVCLLETQIGVLLQAQKVLQDAVALIGSALSQSSEGLLTCALSPKQATLPTTNQDAKMEANEQPFIPTNFEGLPELSDIVVCPSETGSNSYDCLLEAILLPIQYRDIFVGLRSPWKGVLLYGPPGTGKRSNPQHLFQVKYTRQLHGVTSFAGKTKLVQAVCKAASCTLLSVTNSDLLSRWFGESEKKIKTLFEQAKKCAPCVIFLDEIDSLGGSRDNQEDSSTKKVLTELLIQISNIQPQEQITVVGATNRLYVEFTVIRSWSLNEFSIVAHRCDLDTALLRRFERRIEVPLPNNVTRVSLFDLFLGKTEVDGDIDTEVLAQLTEGFSGADIESACREAALNGVRDFFTKEPNGLVHVRALNQQDLLEAVDCCRRQLVAQVSSHTGAGEKMFVCGTCKAIKKELGRQQMDHEQ